MKIHNFDQNKKFNPELKLINRDEFDEKFDLK